MRAKKSTVTKAPLPLYASREGYVLANISFPAKGEEILMGLKAGGRFGEGKWNGPGGKVKFGESSAMARFRELEEETTLVGTKFSRIGMLFSEHENGSRQRVEINLVTDFVGFPRVTEENELIQLDWFNSENVPWDKIWEDQALWLGYVFRRERFTTLVKYDKDGHLTYCYILPGAIITQASVLKGLIKAKEEGTHADREANN